MPCNPDHRVVPAPRRDVDLSEAMRASEDFLDAMTMRRSIRNFDRRPVDPKLIATAIATANTAPSGANRQPWHFVVVEDHEVKRHIRSEAEIEEKAFYESRASEEWLHALRPLGTDWRKPHLEEAPYLIVVFEVRRGEDSPTPYYAKESVGIAVGLLLASLHLAGLSTLTHTPSPMAFLNKILSRPKSERPFAVIPVGYMAANANVPDITKKSPAEVTTWLRPSR